MTNTLERRVNKLEGGEDPGMKLAFIYVDPDEPGATRESKRAEFLAENPGDYNIWFYFQLHDPTNGNQSQKPAGADYPVEDEPNSTVKES